MCGLYILTFITYIGIALNNERNNTLIKLTGMINNNLQCMKELVDIVAEAECHAPGTGVTLQEVWDDDTGDRQQFFYNPVHNKIGNKGNQRSLITYSIVKHCMHRHMYMYINLIFI